ncbi:CDP-diacylglycerol--glycerol-3-phosphate 3-phosphatidyltransferase [Cladobotryum mycophilum]|uniref:CDP-diacylglycerol--glycerol-3-phosphate 3-phosphatidyltransferase n=1 Tax=Cladobotryum mycophilum TaxID=491253 RepID=A0ABR0SVA1_9HYPO
MDNNTFLEELNANMPRFSIQSSNIEILDSPTKFHDVLIAKILSATRRIFLTSLYIGSDAHVLRHTLRKALRSNAQLKLYLLIDKLRGSRADPGCSDRSRTCISLLTTLVQEFGAHRVEIRCYQTPKLRGLWRCFVPERLNEGFGLQHIKLCGVDDEVIVTGANLSQEYFTNREDRYYVFCSEELTDYFHSLVVALGQFSYLLSSSTTDITGCGEHGFEWPSTNYTRLPLDKTEMVEIQCAARHHLIPILWRHSWEHLPFPTPLLQNKPLIRETLGDEDTVVYPLAQLAPLLGAYDTISKRPLSTHEWALSHLLAILPRCSSWTLSTPYLSFPDRFSDTLLSPDSKENYRPVTAASATNTGSIVTAAPEAMSFYGARGLAGYIPRAFTGEAKKLLQRIAQRGSSLRILQWKRGIAHESGGWTFHAKGWWVNCDGSDPTDAAAGESEASSMVMVGSSNYGQRSFTLDLEVDILLVTTNRDLKQRMNEERERILARSEQITTERINKGVSLRALWFGS